MHLIPKRTRRYPPTVMHIFCDGRDKIFCIIGALRFMTIFLLTAMKSAHVFPGNLPEFVFFLLWLLFSLPTLIHLE